MGYVTGITFELDVVNVKNWKQENIRIRWRSSWQRDYNFNKIKY